MAKSVSKNLKMISSLGSRSDLGTLRIISITLFVITLLFGMVYFVSASTADVAGNAIDVDVKGSLYLNIGIISGACFALLVMEFYPLLSDLMKFIRLTLVILVVVFVCLSFSLITELADNATQSGEDTIVYVFASLTVGFASVAGLLNVLEIVRHSGY